MPALFPSAGATTLLLCANVIGFPYAFYPAFLLIFETATAMLLSQHFKKTLSSCSSLLPLPIQTSPLQVIFFHQRNLFSSRHSFLFSSFIPVAGLPEIVRADDPPSPPSLKTASGSWSHAALLEAPIMKCEKKSNRQTAHVVFQQVRFHAQLNECMVLTFCETLNRPLHATHNRFYILSTCPGPSAGRRYSAGYATRRHYL